MAVEGTRIAFSSTVFDTSPTWTRLDTPNSGFVKGYTIDRGRTYELDKTQAGTATITLVDKTGKFDPTNPSSSLYPNIGPMKQARIALQNPVNGQEVDIFTGFVEAWRYSFPDPAARVMLVEVDLVDGFEPLSRAELPPDTTGTTPLPGISGAAAPQQAINAVLDFFNTGFPAHPNTNGWPTAWRNLFTGNVKIKPVVYDPGTSILSAIQDIADAEFPGVSNVFMDKKGNVTFHGRFPRFNPTSSQYGINFWTVGDHNAATTFGAAPIHSIEWSFDHKNLINACLCYPFGIAQSAVSAQMSTNPASILKYGVRAHSLPDLLTNGGLANGNNDKQETYLFAKYYTDNYSTAQQRISHLEFRSGSPSGAAGIALWNMMTNIEISDVITVYTSNPGGGGFGKQTDGFSVDQFFVEGIHYRVNPLTSSYPDVTMTLDVSPRAWFPLNYFT